jgi:hypothetical protein
MDQIGVIRGYLLESLFLVPMTLPCAIVEVVDSLETFFRRKCRAFVVVISRRIFILDIH